MAFRSTPVLKAPFFPQDAEKVQELRTIGAQVLPNLRERSAALQIEVAQEKEAVAEVSACDQGELKDLKGAITEQT